MLSSSSARFCFMVILASCSSRLCNSLASTPAQQHNSTSCDMHVQRVGLTVWWWCVDRQGQLCVACPAVLLQHSLVCVLAFAGLHVEDRMIVCGCAMHTHLAASMARAAHASSKAVQPLLLRVFAGRPASSSTSTAAVLPRMAATCSACHGEQAACSQGGLTRRCVWDRDVATQGSQGH